MSEKSNVIALPRKEATDKQIAEALDNSSRTPEKHQKAVREAYAKYISYGWKPVKIYPGKKRPIGNDWLNKPTPLEEEYQGHTNIGVALGDKSDNLGDTDIDDDVLIAPAELFLPSTGAKFGRYYGTSDQRLAHWLYRCQADKTYVVKKPTGGVAIEFRSTGGQTVFPPSLIFDNELKELDLVCWAGGPKSQIPALESITEIQFDFIKRRINLLCASVYSASQFKEGSFHIDMLAWCGLLAKAGYDRDEAKISVEYIVKETKQTGLEDRLAGLADTYDKYEQGEAVSGISTLKDSNWDEKHVNWLKNLLKIKSGVESDGRPQVRVVASKEIELYDDTLNAMIFTKKFYNMGGQVVVINRETSFDGSQGARITPLADTVAMSSWLTREIQFIQSTLDKAAMTYKDQLIKAPTSVAGELANPHTYRGEMSQIVGLSNIPTITKSGRIVDERWGYDQELKLFFACKYPVRKMYPEEALNVLKELFWDFPFALGNTFDDPEAKFGERYGRYFAAAIAAVLAGVARPAMDICPASAITSSQWSDGKSVMSNAIAAAVGMEGGSANSPLTRGGSDEEQEKQISSVLAKGKRVIVYDNHDGEFRSSALTETLTSPMPEFRVLGKSEIRAVPNRSMTIINGVNMVLAGDLQTRSVMIRLARTELGTIRRFKHMDLVGWAGDNSEKFVSAAISLMDWALHQEDGDWKGGHRFKIWDLLVRRTMILACGVDISPPANEDEERTIDPMEEVKFEFLDWVIGMWNNGTRDPKFKNYIRGSTLADQIQPGSPQESIVDTLSRRRNDHPERKLGKCLAMVKDYPYQNKTGTYQILQRSLDGRMVYFVRTIKTNEE